MTRTARLFPTDVTLSAHPPNAWTEFMAVRAGRERVPEDFLANREQPPDNSDPSATRE